jgi:hypothetical protein
MLYTAIAKENLNAYPHSWTKGLDYQMALTGDRIQIASNQGDISYSIDHWAAIEEKFEISRGWKPEPL